MTRIEIGKPGKGSERRRPSDSSIILCIYENYVWVTAYRIWIYLICEVRWPKNHTWAPLSQESLKYVIIPLGDSNC